MSKIAPALERFSGSNRSDQLIHGQQFLALGDLDEEQAEEVHQRLGQEAQSRIIGDRGRVLALGQFRLVGIAHQRQVHEHRRLEAEILVDQNVLGDRGQPFLATGHMGDLHQVIINDVGHVIGRHAVGLEQHLHVDRIPGDFDLAINAVDEFAAAFGRDLHPHHMRLAGFDAGGDFLGCEVQAAAVIFRRLAGGALGGAHLVEALGRAEAAEAVTVFNDLVDIGTVDVLALALAVGAVGSADVRAFRPGQAAPFQRVENLLFKLRRRTGASVSSMRRMNSPPFFFANR
jgi:hypothetical protein